MANAPQFRGFKTLRVRKERLQEALKVNLEQHKKDFMEARDGYEKEVVKELGRILTLAKEGKEFCHSIDLETPYDHSNDYESVITMLEFSEDDEFEISAQEFNCYVRDEWNWSHGFKNMSASYSNN